jgi:hypothetical protein
VIEHARRDAAAEITHGGDDGSLREGYLGTWKSLRFYNTDVDRPGPRTGHLHHLSCGHWIGTEERTACGPNCRNPELNDMAPFNCAQCYSDILGIMVNELSVHDKEKAEHCRPTNDSYLIRVLVEFISKRTKTKANVAETVVNIVKQGKYGRACNAIDAPTTGSDYSLERQVLQYYEHQAEKKFAAIEPGTARKREVYEQPVQPTLKKAKFASSKKPTTDNKSTAGSVPTMENEHKMTAGKRKVCEQQDQHTSKKTKRSADNKPTLGSKLPATVGKRKAIDEQLENTPKKTKLNNDKSNAEND